MGFGCPYCGASDADGMMPIESLRIWRGNYCTFAGLLINI
jgi:hypothetical protein